MKQKTLKLSIVTILMLSGIRMSAYNCEIDGIYYDLSGNEAHVTYYSYTYYENEKAYVGEIVIPETIRYNAKEYTVTSINSSAFRSCSKLTGITLGDSIKSIGEEAFYHCERLSYIKMPKKLQGIGKNAFSWCKELTSIYIPPSVSFIGNDAFTLCTKLQKVIVPDIAAWCSIKFGELFPKAETSPLYMAKHLYIDDDTEITDLVIPESVKTASPLAFNGWTALKSVTTPESMETLSIFFRECPNLETVTIKSPELIAADKGYETGLSDFFGKQVTTYNISSETTKIGSYTFSHCTSVNTITIPEKVISIGEYAFAWSNSLEEMAIPGNVITIANNVFMGCSNIKTIDISEGVTSIGREAFWGCSELNTIIIPNSVTAVGTSAFDGTAWYNDQPQGVVYVGKVAYSYKGDLQGLIKLRDDTHTIEENAFKDCKNISALSIPSTLKKIGRNAFYGCDKMEKVIIPDIASWCAVEINQWGDDSNPLYYARHIYSDEETEITVLSIPEGVTHIGNYVFRNCEQLTTVNIPNSVTTIGYRAFYGCINLANVVLPEGVKDISSAFEDCKSLETINLPDSLNYIGSMKGTNISKIILPDNVEGVGKGTFPEGTELYVRRGSRTLLALWDDSVVPYEMGSNNLLLPPSIKVESTTQTTATVKIDNLYREYQYCLGWNVPIELNENNEMVLKNFFPGITSVQLLYAAINLENADRIYRCSQDTIITKGIDPVIEAVTTASSVRLDAKYIHGDADIEAEILKVDRNQVDSMSFVRTGLDPNSSFMVEYKVIVKGQYGNKSYYATEQVGRQVNDYITLWTKPLEMKTVPAKVVSVGNIIVAADSNLDDEEENVGFEWRRTDWTDDFASNTGNAALFEGRIEGYIRNMNAERLWKYRPYYLSNTGTYYYGDWVGADPSNTSYFEPTVHTYDKTVIEGNTALVKGYALTGSDKITVQGFKYWKQTSNARSKAPSVSVPSDAKTIESSGQVMTATLTNLDLGATYNYLSFVTTSEEETFYGELREFTTEKENGGIAVNGDANGDGEFDLVDVVAMINAILGKPSSDYHAEAADINDDEEVDVFDVMKAINLLFSQSNAARLMARATISNEEQAIITSTSNGMTLGINDADRFTAFQFDVNVADGVELTDVRLTDNETNHILRFIKSGQNNYKVIGLSLDNSTFSANGNNLVELMFSKDGDVQVSNIIFVTPQETKVYFASGEAVVTDIGGIAINRSEEVFDLSGRKVDIDRNHLPKGLYIINNKKVVIK